MTDAIVEYDREQWRKRTHLYRLRNQNIKTAVAKYGIKNLSNDDLAMFRRMMYDDPGIWNAVFYADFNGNLIWARKPEKFLPPVGRCPNERLRSMRQRNDSRMRENIMSGRPWSEGLEWP